MAGRGRPPGQAKSGGRVKGSLDKQQRSLISEKLAFDVLKTYKRLGPDWLFELAQTRPDLFLSQCLSRLLPPAFKEDADTINNILNIDARNLSEFEAAKRIAFALSKAVYPDPALANRLPEKAPDTVVEAPTMEERESLL